MKYFYWNVNSENGLKWVQLDSNESLMQYIINVVHNKVVRYMTFSKACSRAWPLYCTLDVLPLEILIELEWGKIMYKYQNKMLPAAFDSYFNRPRHHYGTRYAKQENFEIVRINNAKEKSLLKCIGPTKWSHIPTTMKEAPFLKTFVSLYRIHLIDIWYLSCI